MKIGSIVIRCYEFDKILAFWQTALHYVPKEPAKGGWVVLRAPEERGPNVSLGQVPEKRSGKRNRLHLDLYTNNRRARWGGKPRSGRLAIPGGGNRMMTLSC
jgi:Glyoxalase-like domain